MISQEGIITKRGAGKRGAELKSINSINLINLSNKSIHGYTKSDNKTILIERGLM